MRHQGCGDEWRDDPANAVETVHCAQNNCPVNEIRDKQIYQCLLACIQVAGGMVHNNKYASVLSLTVH